MEDKDFVKAFSGFSISYYFDDYVVSYADLVNQSKAPTQTFSFTLTKDAPSMYAGMEFFNPRMYPNGCHARGSNRGTVSITYEGKAAGSRSMSDGSNFIFTTISPAKAGKYELSVSATFGDNDVKDFTAKVYTNQAVTLGKL